jgi:hypothetical protein
MGLVVFLLVAAALVGLVYYVARRGRRYGEGSTPEAGWSATSERFRDPSTDRLMRVWLDRAGERHYVPDDEQQPPPPAPPAG